MGVMHSRLILFGKLGDGSTLSRTRNTTHVVSFERQLEEARLNGQQGDTLSSSQEV